MAARTVRPEKSTSSTRTTVLSSIPGAGIEVCSIALIGFRRRSSRCIVMSRAPHGTSRPSTSAITWTRRRASATPRVGIPRRTRSWEPLLRSRISWATRRRARDTSAELITTRAVSADWSPNRPSGGGTESGRVTAPDLLPRLTGRVVKGCRSIAAILTPHRDPDAARRASDQGRLDLDQPGQQPVDKGRRVVGRQRGGQSDSLGDRDHVGDELAVDDLPGADAQNGPVDGRHAVDRPTLAVGCQQLVDLDPPGDHAADDLNRVVVEGVLGGRLRDPLFQQ